jgi:hypothetical protein
VVPQAETQKQVSLGEEALLESATGAQHLAERLWHLLVRLYDFADCVLVNATEAQATARRADLAHLAAVMSELGQGASVLADQVDASYQWLGGEWPPESDEQFYVSMARLGDGGDPRWHRLAAWWREMCVSADAAGPEADPASTLAS